MPGKPDKNRNPLFEFHAWIAGSYLLLTHINFSETVDYGYFIIFQVMHVLFLCQKLFLIFQFQFFSCFIIFCLHFLQQTTTWKHSPVLRFCTITCTLVFWCLQTQRVNEIIWGLAEAPDATVHRFIDWLVTCRELNISQSNMTNAWQQNVHPAFDSLWYTLPLWPWKLVE